MLYFTTDLLTVIHHSTNLSCLMTKPTKRHVCPAKNQISLGIRLVWSENSLPTWRKLGSLATHWAHSEDSDQTGRMPRLIWVFAGFTVILLVLSWGGSFAVSADLFLNFRSKCEQPNIFEDNLNSFYSNDINSWALYECLPLCCFHDLVIMAKTWIWLW